MNSLPCKPVPKFARTALWLAAGCVLAGSAMAGAARSEDDVFRTTISPVTEAQHGQWNVALTELSAGRVLAIWEAGHTEVKTPNVIMSSLSEDGGRTWSERHEFYGCPGVRCTPCGFYRAKDLLHCVHAELPMAGGKEPCRVLDRASSDGGATWSEAREIWQTQSGVAMQPVVLRDGRIALPVYGRGTNPSGTVTSISRVLVSKDDGATWQESASIPADLPGGAMEPALAETSEGDWLCVIRTRGTGSLYASRSKDSGLTWETPAPLPLESPESIARLLRLDDDSVLVVWNGVASKTQGPRNRLTVARSVDGGRTWPQRRDLVEGGPVFSNHGVMQTNAGRILVGYQHFHRDPVRAPERSGVDSVELASFDLPWLAALEHARDAAPTPQHVGKVIERGLAFLVDDAVAWRKERGCATCHHGTMTVWALSEAKQQGYAVAAEILADNVQWTRDQFVSTWSKPRDLRRGWNQVSMPALYLSVASQSLPILSRDEIGRVAAHLARHQEPDGAWLMRPPEGTGSPPTWESRETTALWALLAWEPSPIDAAREKAIAWLHNTEPTPTTQAAALRLLLDLRTGRPAQQIQSRIDELLKRQSNDGGWSQINDLPSDAYATGQALWALSFGSVKNDRAEIQRAVAFLVANQREDGSWPMTSRNHPGVTTTRTRYPVPITYFGSAWATLGLGRSVPPILEPGKKQQLATDMIRQMSGTFEVDETSADKPVTSARIVYELDDDEVSRLVTRLTALPQLTTLQFKSSKLTDASLLHLSRLSQLLSLTLENAAITDAGCQHLKALTHLETLNLKGTRITEAAIQDLQKALPKLKVEH